jgi:hypothetical protein
MSTLRPLSWPRPRPPVGCGSSGGSSANRVGGHAPSSAASPGRGPEPAASQGGGGGDIPDIADMGGRDRPGGDRGDVSATIDG